MYRFEIYLPIYYNDGKLVEPEKFETTRKEILKKFGGLTTIPGLEGWWHNKGATYKDKVVIYRVDCEEKNNRFWKKYKFVLKKRFEQIELFISVNEISLI